LLLYRSGRWRREENNQSKVDVPDKIKRRENKMRVHKFSKNIKRRRRRTLLSNKTTSRQVEKQIEK
jgi:hypothetical protein